MTEDELFAAVHDYAYETARDYTDFNQHDEPEKARLLAAIREWAYSAEELTRWTIEKEVSIVPDDEMNISEAKIAVCDAYLALDGYTGALTDPEHELRAKVTAAVAVLRELESKP